MPLIDLKSRLSDLKYGKDRPGGGNSVPLQPFIRISPPDGRSVKSPDFLLRNGFLNPVSVGLDIARLAQYFITPRGLLFIAKENLLSQTGTKSQGGIIIDNKPDLMYPGSLQGGIPKKIPNEGPYLPTTSLVQIGASMIGAHLDKTALNPFASVVRYSDLVKNNQDLTSNRLVNFANKKIYNLSIDPVNLYSYLGGPGSVLGIGTTNIKFADQRTGLSNNKNPNPKSTPFQDLPKTKGLGASFKFNDSGIILQNMVDGDTEEEILEEIPETSISSSVYNSNFPNNVYKVENGKITGLNRDVADPDHQPKQDLPKYEAPKNPDEKNKENEGLVKDRGERSFSPKQDLPKYTPEERGATKLFNKSDIEFSDAFLIRRSDQSNLTENTVLGKASTDKPTGNQVYTKNLDGSLELYKPAIDPDRQPKQGLPKFTPKPNTYDPINGKTSRVNYSRSPGEKNPDSLNPFNYSATDRPPLDKINSEPIYRSTDIKPRAGNTLNDFVNFRIAVINNTDPNQKDFIHFRAFLNQFTDSYTAQWDGVNYPGRGEKFYRYSGFDRKFSTSWTVYAQSKTELIPMYQKLNFLASTLAPDYGTNGFMKGNLVQLTLGGYLYEQPGIITSLTYTAPEDSPYETAINDGGVDESVKQLPFRINVSSFEFIPIHEFRPERQIDQFGSNRYIALSDGSTTNY